MHSPLVRRPNERRTEFLLTASPSADIADLLALPYSQAALFPEIAATWDGPLGQNIRVTLSGHAFDELTGHLEIATSPDFPYNHHRALLRRIGEFTFTHRQITGCATA